MRKPVRTKPEFYDRWLKGEFGNRLRVWSTYEDLLASDYRGLIGVRSKLPGRPMKYNVAIPDILDYIKSIGSSPENHTYGEMAPDDCILMQGEVFQYHSGLRLHYSYAKEHMRPALIAAPRHADGLLAISIMRKFMDAASYDDIMDMLNDYDGHVIEFSCYGRKVGTCNRSTLIWEVRHY